MTEIFEIIFSSFWHWLGTFVLLALLVRWRLFYIYLNAGDSGNNKKNATSSTFWKDLADIGKNKPPTDPEP
jgi:hypothetical protein